YALAHTHTHTHTHIHTHALAHTHTCVLYCLSRTPPTHSSSPTTQNKRRDWFLRSTLHSNDDIRATTSFIHPHTHTHTHTHTQTHNLLHPHTHTHKRTHC